MKGNTDDSIMVVDYILTGDIGGTNSRLALYDVHDDPSNTGVVVDGNTLLVRQKEYLNSDYFPKDDPHPHHTDPSIYAQRIVSHFIQYCITTPIEKIIQEEEERKQKNNKKQQDEEETETTINTNLTKKFKSIASNCRIVATLAVAGIVNNNLVNITNLGKGVLIDGTYISNDEKDEYISKIVHCRIINDFVAQGYGCLTLTSKDVKHLYGPDLIDHLPIGPKVCIGAGTGLGECYLTPSYIPHYYSDSSEVKSDLPPIEYNCFPSEGGHVEYAPRNDEEIKLFQYLLHKFESKHRISVERVVSGLGLANVYDYLSNEYPDRVNATIHDLYLKAGDQQGRIVAENVKHCTLCCDAMNIMMSAYGCETGSAAIKWIPIGGLFVTGGITPKNIHHIAGLDSEFMKSYLHKGRVSDLLERIPLYAVMSEDLGVRGVHKAAVMEYEHYVSYSLHKK